MQFVAYVVRAPLCQRMPIVIGGSSGRPIVSGCAWEPRVTQPETFVEGRREILRQASVALGGRPVTVWEVSSRAELEPQASSDPAPTHHTTKLDVDATLRRWNIAIVQGSRWVGCQGAADGFWVVAPVRSEEHTSELQSRLHLVCRLLLEKKKQSRSGGGRENLGE